MPYVRYAWFPIGVYIVTIRLVTIVTLKPGLGSLKVIGTDTYRSATYDFLLKYKLLCPRGTQTCALAVANIKVNGNGKVILDTHPESDQHQN